MKNISILNGGKSFAHSKGELNSSLAAFAENFFRQRNCNISNTTIDKGYDVDEEISKWLWADLVIFQMPAWWMGPPWTVKKYMDEVFTAGHGKLYESDGRSRSDSSKNYGSGGLLQGKKYLLSVAWNAPMEAFIDNEQFFEGVGIDGVYLPVHKANQFLGMEPLETFICSDVMKNPKIQADMERYKLHLEDAIVNLIW